MIAKKHYEVSVYACSVIAVEGAESPQEAKELALERLDSLLWDIDSADVVEISDESWESCRNCANDVVDD